MIILKKTVEIIPGLMGVACDGFIVRPGVVSIVKWRLDSLVSSGGTSKPTKPTKPYR
jgi:hypothetical protein